MKIQLVKWFPDWASFGFRDHWKHNDSLRLVYDWSIYLGFFELRKWHILKPGEVEQANKDAEKP